MPRKDKEPTENSRPGHHGFDDVIGILLVSVAVLLLLSLFSYDWRDMAANTSDPNPIKRNLVGGVGAYLGFGLFNAFGAGAFVLPVLSLFFGLAYLLQLFSYLRQRWWAALVLFYSCMGLLDLYTNRLQFLKSLSGKINAPSAGGFVGQIGNDLVFDHFGLLGATILFLMLYAISLLFMTNFQLGAWMRGIWNRQTAEAETSTAVTPEEKELERKAKELEKQAKKLQDQLEKNKGKKEAEPVLAPVATTTTDDPEKVGIGADGLPVPTPLIRDLSIPAPRAVTKPKKGEGETEPPAEAIKTGAVISKSEVEAAEKAAREHAPASTADILGKAGGRGKKADSTPENDAPKAEETKPETEEALAAAAAPAVAEEGEAVKKPEDEDDLPLPVPARPKYLPKKPKPITVAQTPKIGNYTLPPMDFLQMPDTTLKPTESKEELMANAILMKNTLAQFDIEVAVGDITKGPTITRYELHPSPGVKLEKIVNLSNNIAAALKAERIHILAPVPGKSSVGVEVPNAVKTKVIMRDLLESEEWQKSKARLPIALGKDVYGQPIIADLAEMPHLLIAGSTGSGKSVCVNSIVASLLYRFPPDQLRFVMIDPKVVEMQQYNVLPHLVVPVVTDPKKVILALRWVVSEMEKRYQIFARVGVRNIKSFNERPKDKPVPKPEPELPLLSKKEKVEAGSDGFAVQLDEEIVVPRDEDIVIPERLSYVVVIIDELADLMLVAPADVEMAIARITQMARAAGIHCIVATQRPSVDVITGVIKSNIPARIAFQVASQVDSRTILDAKGADKLLGKGDMLYLPPGSAKLIRAQGVLITDPELQAVVDHIANQAKPSYELEIHQQLQKPAPSNDNDEGSGEDEALIEQCIEVIRSEQKASVSLLQRRLRLGYGRAARIMDELEGRGIVGPGKGAEPRDILIDLDAGQPGQG